MSFFAALGLASVGAIAGAFGMFRIFAFTLTHPTTRRNALRSMHAKNPDQFHALANDVLDELPSCIQPVKL